MRLFFAVGLTAILGLICGAALGGVGAGLPREFLADGPAILDESTIRFGLARGASLGLLAGLALGALHWSLRSAAAARAGGRVGFGRILAGTIGFAFSAAVGGLVGGGLGIVLAGLSPAWTSQALGVPSAADLAYAAAAIGTSRGALLGAGIYAFSALGAVCHPLRREERPAVA
ncbi:MAG TPA: hypothetical protein VFI25_18780 [Planctomycetota bacterium]|jgi:hypothetical protein|nr:hypothetical protein [Planctomycetota bacterium]